MTDRSGRTTGIYAKIERAKKHVGDLEASVQGFIQSNPYEVIRHDEPDTGDWVFKVRVLRQPPLELSAIAGDAIHNLRASLDLLVCELVRGERNIVTDKTSFPIARNAKVFKSGHMRMVEGAPHEAIRLIKRLKPYKGGNEALWRLHKLDIADKHRLLITVGGAHQSVVLDFARYFDNLPGMNPELIPPQDLSMPIGLNAADQQWPLKDGTEVFRVGHGGQNLKMHENPQFTFHVAFGEGEIVQGEPLIPTLHQLVNFVEGVIEPFLPLLHSND